MGLNFRAVSLGVIQISSIPFNVVFVKIPSNYVFTWTSIPILLLI